MGQTSNGVPVRITSQGRSGEPVDPCLYQLVSTDIQSYNSSPLYLSIACN